MGKLVSKDSIPSKFSPKNPKECIICGKMFIGASSNAKTCSPECSIALSQQRQRERFHKKYKRIPPGLQVGLCPQMGPVFCAEHPKICKSDTYS